MPRMNILNSLEREAYDAPPELNSVERKKYFDLPQNLTRIRWCPGGISTCLVSAIGSN